MILRVSIDWDHDKGMVSCDANVGIAPGSDIIWTGNWGFL